MQNPAAWAIAKLFAELLIKFKGTDKQNETNLTLDQWNQLMQSLSSMHANDDGYYAHDTPHGITLKMLCVQTEITLENISYEQCARFSNW